jgi:hypothetical protein
MVICDAIWEDPGTGKPTLLGLFSELSAKIFPATRAAMAAHVALTNAQGKVPFKFVLVDVDEVFAPLYTAQGELEFPHPRFIYNINIHMRGITFPKPGDYRFQLFARGEFLMERQLTVKQA